MSQRGNTPGRLNREPEARAGTVPGFTPQFWESDGHARDVSTDYPYPVKDSSVEDRLADLIEKQADVIEKQGQILERLDSPIDTQLTGRNVELIRFFSTSSTAWRSFADEVSNNPGVDAAQELDVSSYSERVIVIRNDSNGTLGSLRLRAHLMRDDVNFEVLREEIDSVPAMTRKTITSEDMPSLNDPHILQLQLRASLDADEGQYHVAFLGRV